MTWFSNATIGLGLLFLAHACYSAHEHSALQSITATPSSPSSSSFSSSYSSPAAALPIDILIETIVSIFLVCFGLVLGTPELRPIQWRAWAGKIEREGRKGFMDSSGQVDKDYIGNPFGFLESRPGFVDIRKQRLEFAEWVRQGGLSNTKKS